MAGRRDDQSSEDRFGRQHGRQYSLWSSIVGILAAVVIAGLIYFFLR